MPVAASPALCTDTAPLPPGPRSITSSWRATPPTSSPSWAPLPGWPWPSPLWRRSSPSSLARGERQPRGLQAVSRCSSRGSRTSAAARPRRGVGKNICLARAGEVMSWSGRGAGLLHLCLSTKGSHPGRPTPALPPLLQHVPAALAASRGAGVGHRRRRVCSRVLRVVLAVLRGGPAAAAAATAAAGAAGGWPGSGGQGAASQCFWYATEGRVMPYSMIQCPFVPSYPTHPSCPGLKMSAESRCIVVLIASELRGLAVSKGCWLFQHLRRIDIQARKQAKGFGEQAHRFAAYRVRNVESCIREDTRGALRDAGSGSRDAQAAHSCRCFHHPGGWPASCVAGATQFMSCRRRARQACHKHSSLPCLLAQAAICSDAAAVPAQPGAIGCSKRQLRQWGRPPGSPAPAGSGSACARRRACRGTSSGSWCLRNGAGGRGRGGGKNTSNWSGELRNRDGLLPCPS